MSKQASFFESESQIYPEGYVDALAGCTVLGTRLLNMALRVAETESGKLCEQA